jgi:hypothetical protein
MVPWCSNSRNSFFETKGVDGDGCQRVSAACWAPSTTACLAPPHPHHPPTRGALPLAKKPKKTRPIPLNRNFVALLEGYTFSWVNFYPPFIQFYGDQDVAPFGGQVRLSQAEAQGISKVWLYFAGCYWALTTVSTVGYGDISAVNTAELILSMAIQVLGVVFFGLLISTIS